MKGLKNRLIICILAVAAIFCIAACGSTPNEEVDGAPQTGTEIYLVGVDTKNADVVVNNISVCVYALDGTLVKEKRLSQGKAEFELNPDCYVATLAGLTESVSFTSVMLTESNKKATIALENSQNNGFAFTVILIAEEKQSDGLSVQICDDNACQPITFENGNVATVPLSCGEYRVEVFESSNEIYNEPCSVTLDNRFFVIQV